MSEIDPIERRRRQRESAKRRNLTLALIGGGVLVAGLVITIAVLTTNRRGGLPDVPGITAPSESSEGETWSHKELADYLVKKGVKVSHVGGGPVLGQVVGHFADPSHPDAQLPILLCKDRQSAKESAGSNPHAVAWGRFVFTTNSGNPHVSRLAQQIKAVLTGK